MVEEKIEEKKEGVKEKLVDWVPRTKLGRMVKNGEITSYEQIVVRGLKVLEPEIVDYLLPELKQKIVEVRRTTRVTRSGRSTRFRVSVLVGHELGYVGFGIAKDKERFPAVRKATNEAKLNLVKVRKGCGSWECACNLEHSIPFAVEGKKGSVRVKLLPAPRGTNLVIGDNAKDVLRFCGIKDIWSITKGATDTKINFVQAVINALSKTTSLKLSSDIKRKVEH